MEIRFCLKPRHKCLEHYYLVHSFALSEFIVTIFWVQDKVYPPLEWPLMSKSVLCHCATRLICSPPPSTHTYPLLPPSPLQNHTHLSPPPIPSSKPHTCIPSTPPLFKTSILQLNKYILNSLHTGTPNTINFPFVPNGKLMILGVPIFN